MTYSSFFPFAAKLFELLKLFLKTVFAKRLNNLCCLGAFCKFLHRKIKDLPVKKETNKHNLFCPCDLVCCTLTYCTELIYRSTA